MSRDGFISDDFLLQSPAASELYHRFASPCPIIDYHCHLSPEAIANDQRWETITQVWLGGDHYKWRTMRSNGISERYCTGDADDWEKFKAFAETMPYLLRNPMYHWCHLELKRYFGLDDVLLGPDTARQVYEHCNEVIAGAEFSARGLMSQSNVVLVCTTDDPTDTLEHHAAIAADEGFDVQVLPTWRPDKGMAVDKPEVFAHWVAKLAEAAEMDITNMASYLDAIRKRQEVFHQAGCRLSDHGIDTFVAEDYSGREIEDIFSEARAGASIGEEQAAKFKSAMLYEFGLMNAEKGWTQQFHYGAQRNNNTRMYEQLGPDTGFDSIGDWSAARPMAKLLDRLDRENQLARTVIYNLNPRDNHLVATMLGNFQDGSVAGKMQMGSGWWFLDQKDGMERQIEALSQLGLLRRFVGMVTDSRSFLSYTRHEYFRRVLCNILGGDVEAGLVPADMDLLGQTVQDICYNNGATFFGFDLDPLG
jgi:glucuronate isomerase